MDEEAHREDGQKEVSGPRGRRRRRGGEERGRGGQGGEKGVRQQAPEQGRRATDATNILYYVSV